MKALQRQREQETVSYNAEMEKGQDGSLVLGKNMDFNIASLGDVGHSAQAVPSGSGSLDREQYMFFVGIDIATIPP